MSSRMSSLVPAALAALSLVAAVSAFSDMQSPARVGVAMLFLFLAPGVVLMQYFELDDLALSAGLAVAVSLSADMVIGGVMVYTHLWAPQYGAAVLAGLTAVLAAGRYLPEMRPREHAFAVMGLLQRRDARFGRGRATAHGLSGAAEAPRRTPSPEGPEPVGRPVSAAAAWQQAVAAQVFIDAEMTGEVRTTSDVVIGPNGVVNARVEGARVSVRGRLNGNVRCEALHVHEHGIVTGDIDTDRLIVEDGGQIDGSCTMPRQMADSPSPNARREDVAAPTAQEV